MEYELKTSQYGSNTVSPTCERRVLMLQQDTKDDEAEEEVEHQTVENVDILGEDEPSSSSSVAAALRRARQRGVLEKVKTTVCARFLNSLKTKKAPAAKKKLPTNSKAQR